MTGPTSGYEFARSTQTTNASLPLVAFVPSPTKQRNHTDDFDESADFLSNRQASCNVFQSMNPDENPELQPHSGIFPSKPPVDTPTQSSKLNKQLFHKNTVFTVDEIFLSEQPEPAPTIPDTPSKTIFDSENSVQGILFSQEIPNLFVSDYESSDGSVLDSELVISDEELIVLRNIRSIRRTLGFTEPAGSERRVEITAGFFSSLFYDPWEEDLEGARNESVKSEEKHDKDDLFEWLTAHQSG